MSLRSAFKNLVVELLVELLKAYSPTFPGEEAAEVLKEFIENIDFIERLHKTGAHPAKGRIVQIAVIGDH